MITWTAEDQAELARLRRQKKRYSHLTEKKNAALRAELAANIKKPAPKGFAASVARWWKALGW